MTFLRIVIPLCAAKPPCRLAVQEAVPRGVDRQTLLFLSLRRRHHAEVAKQQSEILPQLVTDHDFMRVKVPLRAGLTAGPHLERDGSRPGVSFGGETGDRFEQPDGPKRLS